MYVCVCLCVCVCVLSEGPPSRTRSDPRVKKKIVYMYTYTHRYTYLGVYRSLSVTYEQNQVVYSSIYLQGRRPSFISSMRTCMAVEESYISRRV